MTSQPGQRRLLEVDNELVVPVGKNIRVLQSSVDVIHSWFIPALGVQRYAIPGRTIETWFRADKPGMFYGAVQSDLRHQSQPHADRGARGPAAGIRCLAGRGEDQVLGRDADGAGADRHRAAAPGGGSRSSALTLAVGA